MQIERPLTVHFISNAEEKVTLTGAEVNIGELNDENVGAKLMLCRNLTPFVVAEVAERYFP